jgi:hypothetical protein
LPRPFIAEHSKTTIISGIGTFKGSLLAGSTIKALWVNKTGNNVMIPLKVVEVNGLTLVYNTDNSYSIIIKLSIINNNKDGTYSINFTPLTAETYMENHKITEKK